MSEETGSPSGWTFQALVHPLTRFALVLGGVLGLATGSRLWNQGGVYHNREMMAFSMIAYIAGFLSLLAGAAYHPRYRRLFQYSLFVLYFLCVATIGYNHIRYLNPRYGTDAIAFNHYSAELLLKGKNPYTASMDGAFDRFEMPRRLYTLDSRGEQVRSLSYPALSFLLYTPFVAAGFENLNWIHLLALLVSLALLFFLSPWWLRPVTPLIMFIDQEFIHFATGGVTDVMFLPFLILAVYYWRRHRLLSVVFWAAACCIKQHPWFLAPFMIVAVIKESSSAGAGQVLRELGRAVVAAGAVFVLINLPFFISSPKGWINGVMTPMGRQLILYGAGLVNLTSSGMIPVPRALYTILALSTLATLTAVYYFYYPKIADTMWVLPGIILWITPRSLTSYFIYWAPLVALAAALSADRTSEDGSSPPSHSLDREPEREEGNETSSPSMKNQVEAKSRLMELVGGNAGIVWMTAFPIVIFSIMAAASFAYPKDVQARVIRARDTRKLGVIDSVEIRVTNGSKRSFLPRFAIHWSGNNVYFWDHEDPAPRPLLPNETRVFRIRSRSPFEAPPVGEIFRFRVCVPNQDRFYLSEPYGPAKSPALVFNSGLAFWDRWARSPLSWIPSTPSRFTRIARQRTANGRFSLCESVTQAGKVVWQRVFVSQKISSKVQTVGFGYSSKDYPKGLDRPIQMMGLELELPGGEVAVVSPSDVETPLLAGRRRWIMIHLPYLSGRWRRFAVDMDHVRRYFGYHDPTPFEMRLFVSRHRSLPGSATACFADIKASNAAEESSFKLMQAAPLNNTAFRYWKPDEPHPAGWRLEMPSSARGWGLSRGKEGSVTFHAFRQSDLGPEWIKLALAQRLSLPARSISVEICTPSRTMSLKKPLLAAGVELIDGRTVHVYTPFASTEPATVRHSKQLVFHGVPASIPCTRINIDLAKVKDTHPEIQLFINVHRKRPGQYTASFSNLEVIRL